MTLKVNKPWELVLLLFFFPSKESNGIMDDYKNKKDNKKDIGYVGDYYHYIFSINIIPITYFCHGKEK